MALLNGVRVVLTGANPSLLVAGPAVQGFLALGSAGAMDGFTYQWVLEANFGTDGVATAREGGSGVYSLSGGTLARNTVWSTLAANAQVSITGLTHLIVTPMALQLAANTATITGAGTWTVTSELSLLVNKTAGSATSVRLPTCAARSDPLLVKDIKGDADSNNITITPFGAEKIDGQINYVIDVEWGFITLSPLSTGGYYTS